MRYVRPRDYALNPRVRVNLLDGVVERFQRTRRTFTEDEAVASVWADGEDVRLREDPRFWEIAGGGHFHLAHHRLANETLADRFWGGLWDGSDLDQELTRLDAAEAGTVHVFCAADPHFRQEGATYVLVARPKVACPTDVAVRLEAIEPTLLEAHRSLGVPRSTRELLEMAVRLDPLVGSDEDALDHLETWLGSAEEWTEISRGLWLPADLVPTPEPPKAFRVRAIRGTDGEGRPIGHEVEIVEPETGADDSEADARRIVLPDPPVGTPSGRDYYVDAHAPLCSHPLLLPTGPDGRSLPLPTFSWAQGAAGDPGGHP